METKEKLTTILLNYPLEIENKVLNILKKKQKIDDLKTSIQKVKLRIDFDVLEDSQKEQWAKELSNDSKRKKEVISRLGRDETYLSVEEALENEKEWEIPFLEAEISRMRREFETAKVLLPFLVGGKND